MTGNAHFYLRRHEFDEPGIVMVRPGQTLRRMLVEAAGHDDLPCDLVVRVQGHEVPVQLWDRVRPKPGVRIDVVRTALAGGDSWKQILGAVVMIVVSYYAPGWGQSIANAAGWGANAANAISAGIVMAAAYAVNALVRVPVTPGGGGNDSARWNQLTGSSNQINPWGAIPVVLGEHRHFPPHAAMPYTTMVGQHSYQHCMFDLGLGLLNVSEIKIGDTDLAEYDDVAWELSDGDTPATLYTNDVSEDGVQVTMNEDSDTATRTTAPNVDTISLDVLFPQGLKVFGDSLDKGWPMWVLWRIEYRAAGSSGAWSTPTGARLSEFVSSWTPGGSELPATAPSAGLYLVKKQTRHPFAAGISWNVAPGQYDVRVTRHSTKDQTTQTWADSAIWLVMRSIRKTDPTRTGTSKLVMRIRATDQLTGTLQNLTALVKQSVRVYNRGAGTWSWQYSRNPAWVAYWLMTRSPAVPRRVPESRMDLDSFADFADYCAEHGFETRMVADTQMLAADLVRKVLGGALGDIGMRDGKYCVVWDRNDPVETMLFTPAETGGFRTTRTFTQYPDALRVQFKNPLAGWVDDEIIVVRDGFSYRGLDARGNASAAPEAEKFETLPLQQTMLPTQAWKLGRFHIAQALYRPSVHEWSSDIAGLSVARGDTVRMVNDVPEWGAGWGRVLSLEAGGIPGAAATVTLDNEIETNAGTAYRMQFRTAAGIVTANLVAAGGRTHVFALATMPAGVAAGDVAALGDVETDDRLLIVTGVRYTANLGTQFTATDYDERVYPYWQDPPETFVSEVTGTTYGLPAPPVVTSINTGTGADGRDDAGIATPTVRVGTREESAHLHLVRLQLQ